QIADQSLQLGRGRATAVDQVAHRFLGAFARCLGQSERHLQIRPPCVRHDFRSSRGLTSGVTLPGGSRAIVRYGALTRAVSPKLPPERGDGVATVDECRTALHGLAAKLDENVEARGKLDFERTLACRVPDLETAFHARLSGGRLLDIA